MASLISKERLILGFHKLKANFFHRLVHDLGRDPTTMRWVIAFWLWLESVGHHDFIRRAYAMPGPVVLRLVEEAVVCVSCLAGESQDGADSRLTSLPCTNAFLADAIDDVGYFVEHRKKILKVVTYMYRTVCLVACIGNANTRAPAGNTNTGGAAPPRSSSPGNRAATLPMSSPGRGALAPLMISSPGQSVTAPLMMSSPGRGPLAPLMMSSPGREAPASLMMSSPGREAPAPLMMSSPGRSGPLVMNTAHHGAPLMINSPEEHTAPLMMSFPGPGDPLMMGTPCYAPMLPSTLNPMASPWIPMQGQSALPEDYRSLFITFSKGYPVSRDDILEFFNS
jgi:hypothetical protein